MLRSPTILRKSLICLTALSGIILMFAHSAVPDMPVWKVLLYAFGITSVLAICLLSVIIVGGCGSMQTRQVWTHSENLSPGLQKINQKKIHKRQTEFFLSIKKSTFNVLFLFFGH